MKKNRLLRRFLGVALTLALAVSLLTVPALADTSGEWEYEVVDGKAAVTGYNGSDEDLTIPSKIDGYPVTGIESRAFDNCSTLHTVTIPSGVTSIGDFAFNFCRNMTDVILPNGLTSIGVAAFQRCTALQGVTLPESLKSIGHSAFNLCSALTSLTIPAGVTEIGYWAFGQCRSLTSFTVAAGNQNYCAVDGVLFTYDRKTLHTCPAGKSGAYAIPSGVTVIEDDAFSGCSRLTAVTIPNTVTYIGTNAFQSCSGLTEITVPSGATSIQSGAFSGCRGVTAFTVAAGNTSYCAVDGVLFTYDRKTLHTCPAGKSGAYEVPSGVTGILDRAFSNCSSLTAVTIPSGVTSIGNSAFILCSAMTSVTIPESVVSIGYGAFDYCSVLENVNYGGTQAQWEAIEVGSSNDPLLNAAIHYGQSGEPADPLSIRYGEKTVKAYESFQFTATGGVSPYTWRTGNTSVATVSSTGKVTGVAEGSTYLYCKDAAGTEVKCLLKITANPVSIRYGEKSLQKGGTFQFTAAGGSGSYTWRTGNTSIATVDSTGKVTGVAEGSTYLYCTDSAGNQAKCLLKIVAPLSIRYSEKSVKVGESFQFTATGGVGSKTWRVGNTAVAAVDGTGKVTAKSVGNTYLYCKDAAGTEVKCLLKVTAEPLSIRYSSKTIVVGQSFQFSATGGVGTKTWRTGNSAVATVDSTGKVTGVSAGNTWLYCTDSAGTEVKCLLKIVPALTIHYTEKTVKVGASFQFNAEGGTGGYTWRTGNTSVAAVDGSGKVTGKAAGNTYLYCRDSAGNEVKCLLKIKA